MSEEDYNRGAKDERDRIVAWLMARAQHHHKGGTWIPEKSLHGRVALQIERCDHWHPVPAATKPKGPLLVVRAALKHSAGTGMLTLSKRATHAEIERHWKRKGYLLGGYERGYLLSDGRFVDCAEAGNVALASRQVKSLRSTHGLLVEDLP